MQDYTPARLRQLEPLADALVFAARATAQALARKTAPAPRRRAQTLHPGAETPLWNELAREVGARLVKRGEKIRLARLLGFSRQRLHKLLNEKSACPDAERTLLLLAWLHARRQGRDLT